MLVVLGVPGVDVGLAAGGQGGALPGEPSEEGGGVFDLVAGMAAASRSDRFFLCPGAEPRQDFPGGEAADELSVVGVGNAGEVASLSAGDVRSAFTKLGAAQFVGVAFWHEDLAAGSPRGMENRHLRWAFKWRLLLAGAPIGRL